MSKVPESAPPRLEIIKSERRKKLSERIESRVQLRTSVPVEMRTYINYLASRPDLFPSLLVSEFFSYSLYHFLQIKPWKDKANWMWERPASYYTRKKSDKPGVVVIEEVGSWVPLNPAIEAFKSRTADSMIDELISVGDTHCAKALPPIKGNVSTVTYNYLKWATSELFPQSTYFKKLKLPIE